MQTYRPRHLRAYLAPIRGKAIPERTLKYWRKRLGIHPDHLGWYDEDDFQLLKRLILALKDGLTIEKFIESERNRYAPR